MYLIFGTFDNGVGSPGQRTVDRVESSVRSVDPVLRLPRVLMYSSATRVVNYIATRVPVLETLYFPLPFPLPTIFF